MFQNIAHLLGQKKKITFGGGSAWCSQEDRAAVSFWEENESHLTMKRFLRDCVQQLIHGSKSNFTMKL